MDNLGRILFIVGIIAAAALGVGFGGEQVSWVSWLLVILGAVVGFLNISGSETRTFLVAGIALILTATAFREVPVIGKELTAIMNSILGFLSGAIFVVAAKSLFDTARD